MKVRLKYNGSVDVELEPENDIERAYVVQMVESAEKGRTVTLTGMGEGAMVVSVPK